MCNINWWCIALLQHFKNHSLSSSHNTDASPLKALKKSMNQGAGPLLISDAVTVAKKKRAQLILCSFHPFILWSFHPLFLFFPVRTENCPLRTFTFYLLPFSFYPAAFIKMAGSFASLRLVTFYFLLLTFIKTFCHALSARNNCPFFPARSYRGPMALY